MIFVQWVKQPVSCCDCFGDHEMPQKVSVRGSMKGMGFLAVFSCLSHSFHNLSWRKIMGFTVCFCYCFFASFRSSPPCRCHPPIWWLYIPFYFMTASRFPMKSYDPPITSGTKAHKGLPQSCATRWYPRQLEVGYSYIYIYLYIIHMCIYICITVYNGVYKYRPRWHPWTSSLQLRLLALGELAPLFTSFGNSTGTPTLAG